MTAYTDSTAIAGWLGVTFTPEQAAQADQLAAAATAFVDGYTGRTWQTVSPSTGETEPVFPALTSYPGCLGVAYLRHAPVVAVSAVGVRTAYPNDPTTPLDASAYELVDAAHGVLTLTATAWYPGLFVVADYTYSDAVPADVELATTMIAAGAMQSVLAVQAGSALVTANPSLAGVESLAVGQNDINVKLSSAATAGAGAASSAGSGWAAPGSAVAAILDRYRKVVLA
jgi:hypothetical protein